MSSNTKVVNVGGINIPLTRGEQGQWEMSPGQVSGVRHGVQVGAHGDFVVIIDPNEAKGILAGSEPLISTLWKLDSQTGELQFVPDMNAAGAQGLVRRVSHQASQRVTITSLNGSSGSTRLAPGPSGDNPTNNTWVINSPIKLSGNAGPIWELVRRGQEESAEVQIVLGSEGSPVTGEFVFEIGGGRQVFSNIVLNNGNRDAVLKIEGELGAGKEIGLSLKNDEGRKYFLFETLDGTLVLTDGSGLKSLVDVQKYAPEMKELQYAHLLDVGSDARLGRIQAGWALSEHFIPRSWSPSTEHALGVFVGLGDNIFEIPVRNNEGRWVLGQNHGHFNGHPFFIPNQNQNLAVFVGPLGPFPVLMEPPGRGLSFAQRITPHAFQYAYNRHFQNPTGVSVKNEFGDTQKALLQASDSRRFNDTTVQIGTKLRGRLGRTLAGMQSRWVPDGITLKSRFNQLRPDGALTVTGNQHPGYCASVRVNMLGGSSGTLAMEQVYIKGPDGLMALLAPKRNINQGIVPNGFIAETYDGRPVYVGAYYKDKGFTVLVTGERGQMNAAVGNPSLLKRLLNETDGFTTLTHEAYVEHCRNTGTKPLSAKSSGLYGGMTVAMGTGWGYESILQGLEKISGRHFSQNVHQDWAQLPIGLASALFASHYSGGKVSFRNGLGGFVRGNILANPLMELTRMGFQSLLGGSSLVSAANFGLGFVVNRVTDSLIENSPYKKLFTTLGYLSLAASLIIDENADSDFSSTLSTNSQRLKSVVNSLV